MQELVTAFGKVKIASRFGSEFLPVRSTKGAAGFDLIAPEDYLLPPGERTVIDTGLTIDGSDLKIPFMMMIVPRCSTGVFDEITISNTAAIIDMDYNGPDDNIYVFLRRRSVGSVVSTALTRKMYKLEEAIRKQLGRDIESFKASDMDEARKKTLIDSAKENALRKFGLSRFNSNVKSKLENNIIKKGMAYAQIIFVPVLFPDIVEVGLDEMHDKSRGGMGSTGR